jgi:hypothetical protein
MQSFLRYPDVSFYSDDYSDDGRDQLVLNLDDVMMYSHYSDNQGDTLMITFELTSDDFMKAVNGDSTYTIVDNNEHVETLRDVVKVHVGDTTPTVIPYIPGLRGMLLNNPYTLKFVCETRDLKFIRGVAELIYYFFKVDIYTIEKFWNIGASYAILAGDIPMLQIFIDIGKRSNIDVFKRTSDCKYDTPIRFAFFANAYEQMSDHIKIIKMWADTCTSKEIEAVFIKWFPAIITPNQVGNCIQLLTGELSPFKNIDYRAHKQLMNFHINELTSRRLLGGAERYKKIIEFVNALTE